MSNVPRGWTTDEGRRGIDAARWPVLARLPDASADTCGDRLAKPTGLRGIEYRFDLPQSTDSAAQSPTSAKATVSQQPHIFERGRRAGTRGIPRRESPVLPRSNPFSNPRPRLVDSIAPAVRFLTMVALFTAVGVWAQMLGQHAPAPSRSTELPKTAAHPAIVPAKNAGDHTTPAPTATGPIDTRPESGARVGRTDGDDFASQNSSAAGPVPAINPTVSPPHFLISSGNNVPRVRVEDSNPTAASGNSTQGEATGASPASNGEPTSDTESVESSNVARYPGFSMDISTH
jgi:hypothetical protein